MKLSAANDAIQITRKPLLSISEAAALLGWGTSKAYLAARRGDLPGLVRVNGRLHVRTAMLLRWLDGEPTDHKSGVTNV